MNDSALVCTEMTELVKIIVRDRLDRSFVILGRHGQSIRNWMAERFIPSSAVVLRVNGAITDDRSYRVDRTDAIEVDMVRAYQLPEYCNMLGLWDAPDGDSPVNAGETIYTSEVLWFNETGISELKRAAMNREQFVAWLERKFVEGILGKDLVSEGDRLCLALSGGRDSLALLYLFHNTRGQLPDFDLVGCTVAPTAASGKDLEIAAEAIAALGVTDYTVIGVDQVNAAFNLRTGFDGAINRILAMSGRGKSMASWHSIMRTSVERFARSSGLRKIAFGYQHEDLVASIIRSQSLGILFGESPYRKAWGDFEIVCPLWPITKKELTIYLGIVAPAKHVSQGSPTNFDRGDHNRDLNYFIGDLLSSTVPGYGYQLLEGAALASGAAGRRVDHLRCANCDGLYQFFSDLGPGLINPAYCGTCTYLNDLGELRFLRSV